ncbi:MAG TPA: histidine ammonia-lyase [Candidatus Ozemobacteraceae bacterium]|nr:histidine ammonia-lyase [Candidatus Ozemobacteraceae bacterium]HQG27876.1 histidine ammonia-lyase [Candidatus Ozemobacteraceae bacterium]
MIELTGTRLTLEQLRRIADGERVSIASSAMAKVRESRAVVERLIAEDRVVYGITTGFGHLCNTRISREDLGKLQTNLIRSHATGVGEPFGKEEVRAMIAIRINSLLHGVSGIRPEAVEALAALLNNDVTPWVPSQGSVGSSGDLAPLSHIMLVLMGEGFVMDADGKRVPTGPVLERAGLKAISLQAKEGLALINGTSVMTGVLGLAVQRGIDVARAADVIAALSLEVLKGSTSPYNPDFIALRPYEGLKQTAANVLACVADSEVRSSHVNCTKVQDAYSLRCVPQVHGATRETLNHLAAQVSIELNSVTDNPILLSADTVISGGHFHGQPMALAADFFGIAMAELANISERRIDRLVNPLVSGLPPFLAGDAGVNSGLMIVQYTAASIVSENKVLAHPASVDSIPTSAYQEDHVSMGTVAARKGARILSNTAQVLAIEWLCACQAYEFLKPLALGKGTAAAYEVLRAAVPPLKEDRFQAPDLEMARELLWKGDLVTHVAKRVQLV